MNSLNELKHEMLGAGLMVNQLVAGKLTRCKTNDDKGANQSGWYRIFDNSDLVTCVYGDWRTGIRHVWTNSDKPRTTE